MLVSFQMQRSEFCFSLRSSWQAGPHWILSRLLFVFVIFLVFVFVFWPISCQLAEPASAQAASGQLGLIVLLSRQQTGVAKTAINGADRLTGKPAGRNWRWWSTSHPTTQSYPPPCCHCTRGKAVCQKAEQGLSLWPKWAIPYLITIQSIKKCGTIP